MIEFLRDAPLQRKITWVAMLTALTTLILAVVSISIVEIAEFRRSFLRELRSIAGVTGGNSVAALEFQDSAAAQRTLAVLREDPRIIEATLYDASGQRFATYAVGEVPARAPTLIEIRQAESADRGLISVQIPIFHKKRTVGAIIVTATQKQLTEQLTNYGSITFLIFICSCLGAYALSSRLRDIISRPIIRLSETMQQVSKSGNFSLRAAKESDDETGALVEQFNHMLDQIESTTERLAANEHQLRLITDSLPVLISFIDGEERYRFANAAYEKFFKRSPASFAGKTVREVIGEPYYASIRHHLSEVYAGEMVRFETAFPFSDLGERYFSVTYIPNIDGGTQNGFVALAADITERKLAEAEREQLLQSERSARGEAERASRLKDDFLTTLSHELRTPLNAIVGWSQLLSKGNRSREQVAEGLSVILRNARIQTQLIEDLLDLSRIVSGKIALERKAVEMDAVVSDAVDAVTLSAQAKGIRISRETDRSTHRVRGDASRLQQVVWNLLVNAVKFTPSGGSITIALRTLPGGEVETSVRDSGQGISADFIPFVFERFRQADSSTTRRQGGLGIGLSLVKQLVELHGGSVAAESGGEGAGSTFSFKLPLDTAPAANAPQTDANEDRNEKLRGLRILVVDDDDDARGIVVRMLEEHHAITHSAKSAEEGLASIREHAPDIVVSDIGMPDHDGYEFIGWIRSLSGEEGGSIPVIALTAFAHENDRRRILLSGFNAHVPKPIDQHVLIAAILAQTPVEAFTAPAR